MTRIHWGFLLVDQLDDGTGETRQALFVHLGEVVGGVDRARENLHRWN